VSALEWLKGVEIPAQGRDSKIFEITFLGFATHLAIPGLTRDSKVCGKILGDFFL